MSATFTAKPRPSIKPSRPANRFDRPSPGQSSQYPAGRGPAKKEVDHPILFQKFFKSVGPRTYAAQVKLATNGNQYLVLMEGKRDEKTGTVKKARTFVYSEDYVEFFRLIKAAAEFIKLNPLPTEVQVKRQKYWERQNARR